MTRRRFLTVTMGALVLGVMVAIAIAMLGFFKLKKWI